MELRQSFEMMIKDHFPDANLTLDQTNPVFYQDLNIHTAWVGFAALHSEQAQDTTKGTIDNHEPDSESTE